MNPFNEYPGEYDRWYEENHAMYEWELRAIGELLPAMEGCQSLEIGIGTGRFGIPLGFTHGLDPGENLVRRLKDQAIEVQQGVAEALPYADETFDVVGIFTALEFFTSPKKAMQEVWRVLKPEGGLVMGFLNPDGPMGQWIWHHREEDRWFKHAQLYSWHELESLLTKAQLRKIEMRQIIMEGDLPKLINHMSDGLYTVIRAEKMA